MSAQYSQSKLQRRIASGTGGSRLAGSAPDRTGASLTEVVTTELAVKQALAPLHRQVFASGVTVACEIMSGVGRYVLGNRRQLTSLVAIAAAEGIAACRAGEVHVRIARQYSGFDATDTLLVSITIQKGDVIEDISSVESSQPLAEGEELGDAIVLAGRRVLIVAPTANVASIQVEAATRFGASADCVHDDISAQELLRAGHRQGKRFDVLYVDEATSGAVGLLAAVGADASFGAPFRLVATSIGDASMWAERAESILTKPVLPLELCDALREAGHEVEKPSQESSEALTRVPPGGRRRSSGIRPLGLAATLAAGAVAPARDRR